MYLMLFFMHNSDFKESLQARNICCYSDIVLFLLFVVLGIVFLNLS